MGLGWVTPAQFIDSREDTDRRAVVLLLFISGVRFSDFLVYFLGLRRRPISSRSLRSQQLNATSSGNTASVGLQTARPGNATNDTCHRPQSSFRCPRDSMLTYRRGSKLVCFLTSRHSTLTKESTAQRLCKLKRKHLERFHYRKAL